MAHRFDLMSTETVTHFAKLGVNLNTVAPGKRWDIIDARNELKARGLL